MKVTVLASGSSGNAVVLSYQGKHVLLDAGLPIADIRKRWRRGLSNLSCALVTHEHHDHAQGVAGLLKSAVDVFASRGTWEKLGYGVGIDAPHRAWTVTDSAPLRHDGWGITGYNINHDAAEPLAFYVERGRFRALYVTDAQAFTPPEGMKPTHVLIEANHRRSELELLAEFDGQLNRVVNTHMSIESATETLAALDLGDLAEVHLLHISDRHGNESEFIAEIEAAVGVPVLVSAAASRREAA